MSQEVALSRVFSLVPRTLEEAMKFANLIKDSSLVPKDFRGKDGDIVIAMQMGAEVGLAPVQSIQNIAVINGRPSIWGDAALALVLRHPDCEWIDEKLADNDTKAVCTVKRKGHEAYTVTFTVDDAKKASLWGKIGPWQNYPKRMLQMRARGFALRDKFSDALKGLILREEAIDYPVDVTPLSTSLKENQELIEHVEAPISVEPKRLNSSLEPVDEAALLEGMKETLKAVESLDDLRAAWNDTISPNARGRSFYKEIAGLKDKRKKELEALAIPPDFPLPKGVSEKVLNGVIAI